MKDELVRAMTKDGFVNAVAVTTTGIVERARQIHKTLPTATAALGRLLTAASMMGNMQKVDDGSITLQIKGGGPLGTLLAVSDAEGNVRGWVEHPQISLLEKYRGKLDVGAAVGSDGTLTVIRDLRMKDPYIGSVQLVSGEIAEDITQYLYHSEQQPGVCALGVLVDRDRTVRAAGGFILSLLPGADEEVVARVEKDIAALPPVTQMLDSGMSAEDIAAAALKGSFGSVVKVRETGYRCRCSETRVREMLISLGRSELEQLAAEGKEAEVACHFCDKVYHVSLDDVLAMIQE